MYGYIKDGVKSFVNVEGLKKIRIKIILYIVLIILMISKKFNKN